MRAADAVLLVSTLCAPALRDAAKTAAMARTLDTPVRGVVLTRTRSAPDAVTDLLDCPVAASIPRPSRRYCTTAACVPATDGSPASWEKTY
ncbi:hypothetical protein [Haloplanus litoreus]|uniref:hypothetical protein n=1 Tax=Haloplanus litoreus TaxID=767515 RepID=UPI003A8CBC0D